MGIIRTTKTEKKQTLINSYIKTSEENEKRIYFSFYVASTYASLWTTNAYKKI